MCSFALCLYDILFILIFFFRFRWKRDADIAGVQLESRVFGFVARKHSGASDNACHLFAELDPEQPASAIVNFVTKIMIGQSSKK